MRGRPQNVTVSLRFPEDPFGERLTRVLEGTNHKNLRSKIGAAVDHLLLQYNVMDGATITVSIEEAEEDEFANPER